MPTKSLIIDQLKTFSEMNISCIGAYAMHDIGKETTQGTITIIIIIVYNGKHNYSTSSQYGP